MSLIQRTARSFIAAAIVAEAVSVLRHPEPHIAIIESIPLPEGVALPVEPKQLAQISGAMLAGIGPFLPLKTCARLCGVLGVGVLGPATAVRAYAYVTAKPPQGPEREAARTDILWHLAMTGALILIAADRGGKPSRAWLAQQRKRDAKRAS